MDPGGGPRLQCQAEEGDRMVKSGWSLRVHAEGGGGSSGDWAVDPGGGPRLRCQAEEGDRMVKSGWSLRVHAEGRVAAQGTGRWPQAVDPGCGARRRRVAGW